MSTTTYGVNDALSNKLWAKKLNVEALKTTYFGKFMGESSSNMIQVKTEFEKNAGDQVTIGLRVQLAGDGVTEGQVLQGNEEALSTYSDALKIGELAHAVRVRNKNTIDAQRVPFNLRSEGKDGLTDWFSNRFDTTMANHLAGNTLVTDSRYTGNNAITAPTNIYRKGAATDDATINGDNTATFNLGIIDALVERAGVASPLVRPIMVNGERKYVMFLHDYQVTDMRTNTNAGQWLDIQKAALAGGIGTKSPIYNGALGEYNNVVLHKWNRLPYGISNAGVAQTNTRRAVFCGAQAAAVGFGKEFAKGSHFKWVEELFDYERELGVSAQTVWGIKKSVFNGADFAALVATTYAVAH
ncbi:MULTISPECIES: N4-gp56 family major capsid protein [unclassified Bradyrhizobium]|uniref:N4-gp56 family major capsid protein n=1 Tax=unclassified Bradyrhizobium TaxID=2631580 RepID=UPI001BAD9581|nr:MULTISPECIES: N4-gp56 family major capsid protein [unclassified Bradyrhizobium]MBR1206611.1 N4-gp56 family major capsid protein [Bradyrhizobium sp. AUGA SZCCT0124]MBR1315411.1 N4-gp56 family major capsid protein [Bradyrhizobium sp. AUGA SZCCT0051]MBR1338527.1 N4-gp56 family major capsid protein [Bradyrhizobium sp. AUGA SZCCT0105]MBR1356182.1 N4-gp56 family major capsid protein [Bradyrhizobium sp. AUGA SZCCT0045]